MKQGNIDESAGYIPQIQRDFTLVPFQETTHEVLHAKVNLNLADTPITRAQTSETSTSLTSRVGFTDR